MKSEISEPLKSFDLQKELNPAVWDKDKLHVDIRQDLMEIANDAFDAMELDIKYKDIVLTGSLANYNWSKYSDFDLHIILTTREVNRDTTLVKKYFDEYKSNWNTRHSIMIHGYDVEIYLQDEHEPHTATGVFSILNNKWLVTPSPFKQEIDKATIKLKSEEYMEELDALEEIENSDDYDYEEFNNRLAKVWKKIKDGRKAGLEEGGELGAENLVFKLLRRNGYLAKVIDLKAKTYDTKHSME